MVAISASHVHMWGMEQEYLTPEGQPRSASTQAVGPFGSTLAAVGVTLMTLCLLGSAAAASVWAFAKLLGLPDVALYIAFAISAVPVLWATIWTAGRAWHVEQRLGRGLDVDTPVFQTTHYFSKRP
jgi:hypothetical protein